MSSERPSIFIGPGRLSVHRWPRPSGMPSVFTAYVRSQKGEETPDADLFHDVKRHLLAVLAGEMRRRGLWQSPPRYLGVFGFERWDDDDAQDEPAARGAQGAGVPPGGLGELFWDCFNYVFVHRLRSLKRQLTSKPDIDGLVLLNVRHFLHERQRDHDPVGYRVFEVLRAAVKGCLASGRLHLLAGDGRVRNDTILGFSPETAEAAAAADLSHLVTRWNDTLLSEMMTARGRRRQEWVEARLRQGLLELREQGIRAFRFKDLIDPLKSDARQRWAALFRGGEAPAEGGVAAVSQAPGRPAGASAVEARQSQEFMARCVSSTIRHIDIDPQTRRYLATLWKFLRLLSSGSDDAGDGGAAALRGQAGERHPSFRQLSQRLNIPRGRLPMLCKSLQQMVTRCGAATRARRALPKRRRRPPTPRT